MSKGWVITRGIGPSHELSIREVVTLRATLGAQNDEWLLSRQNDASSDISTAAILSKPEWCPEPWPFDADTEADDLLVQLAALKKFAIFFRANSRIHAELPNEIETELERHLQSFQSVQGLQSALVGTTFYINVSIWSDGAVRGGFETAVDDSPRESESAAALEGFEIVVKNRMRIRLLQCIAETTTGRTIPW